MHTTPRMRHHTPHTLAHQRTLVLIHAPSPTSAVAKRYSAARQEQFASFDDEIKTAALGALSAFAKALDTPQPRYQGDGGAAGVDNSVTQAAGQVADENTATAMDVDAAVENDSGEGSPLSELLDPIVSEGVRHLSDFDMGFVKIQTRLMAACARVSPTAATVVFSRYVAAALAKRADPGTSPVNRVVYVESVRDLLAAVAEVSNATSCSSLIYSFSSSACSVVPCAVSQLLVLSLSWASELCASSTRTQRVQPPLTYPHSVTRSLAISLTRTLTPPHFTLLQTSMRLSPAR